MEQLVRDGRLKQFLYRLNGQGDQVGSGAQGNASSRPPLGRPALGTINDIFAAPARTGSHLSRVMSVAWPPVEDSNSEPKKARVEIRRTLSFSDEDKVGTIQPLSFSIEDKGGTIQLHDDALVVTLKIEGMM